MRITPHLLLFVVFSGFSLSAIFPVSIFFRTLFLVVLFAIPFLYLMHSSFMVMKRTILPISLFILVCSFYGFYGFDDFFSFAYLAFQLLVSIFCLFLAMYCYRYNVCKLYHFSRVGVVLSAAGFTLSYLIAGSSFFFLNPNSAGMFAFVLVIVSLFFFDKTVFKYFFVIFFVIVVIFSGSRSSLLALVVFFSGLILSRIFPFRVFFIFYILSVFFVGFVSVLFVSGYLLHDLYAVANVISVEFFGKNLASGRGDIWRAVLTNLQGNSWSGLGSGVMLSDISDYTYSVHNLYLQVALKIGVFGLISLLLLFLSLPFIFYRRLQWRSRVALSAYAGLLTINFFEITLTQNNLALSVPILVFMGFAFGEERIRRIRYENYFSSPAPC